VTKKISNKEIICLKYSCGKTINLYIVKQILPPQEYEKYEILWIKELKFEIESADNKAPEKTKKVNIYDDLFEHIIYKKSWKRCPVCNSVIEKIGGACDYVKCESNKCLKQTLLCYVCGKKIENPLKHFINHKCKHTCKKELKANKNLGKNIEKKEKQKEEEKKEEKKGMGMNEKNYQVKINNATLLNSSVIESKIYVREHPKSGWEPPCHKCKIF